MARERKTLVILFPLYCVTQYIPCQDKNQTNTRKTRLIPHPSPTMSIPPPFKLLLFLQLELPCDLHGFFLFLHTNSKNLSPTSSSNTSASIAKEHFKPSLVINDPSHFLNFLFQRLNLSPPSVLSASGKHGHSKDVQVLWHCQILLLLRLVLLLLLFFIYPLNPYASLQDPHLPICLLC